MLFPSIQLQAECDRPGRFLDTFVGYLGSVHDARVLRNSPIISQSHYPPAGFSPPGRWWSSVPGKNLFQSAHATSCLHGDGYRSVITSSFRGTFHWWKNDGGATLFKALEVSQAFAPDVINCCALLHNLCLKTNDTMEMEDTNETWRSSSSPPWCTWQTRNIGTSEKGWLPYFHSVTFSAAICQQTTIFCVKMRFCKLLCVIPASLFFPLIAGLAVRACECVRVWGTCPLSSLVFEDSSLLVREDLDSCLISTA